MMLTLVTVLPLVAVGGIAIIRTVDEEKIKIEHGVARTVDGLLGDIDRQIIAIEAELQALAVSPGLQSEDLYPFYLQMNAALPLQGTSSKRRIASPDSAGHIRLLMVSLEPFELLDDHRAGRKRVGVRVRDSDCDENRGKARIRHGHLARILNGGNSEIVDHLFGALDALDGDAAAMRVAKQKAAGFREQHRIGRFSGDDPDE
jgi:hypothetical protein